MCSCEVYSDDLFSIPSRSFDILRNCVVNTCDVMNKQKTDSGAMKRTKRSDKIAKIKHKLIKKHKWFSM